MNTETNLMLGSSWDIGTLPDHGSKLFGLSLCSSSQGLLWLSYLEVPILMTISPVNDSDIL
jgi:hypothetical protein